MNKIYLLAGILIYVILGISCNDDGNLKGEELNPYELSLADGGHDYDVRIKDWYDRTGIYILYRFRPADVYFKVDDEWAEYYADTHIDNSWFKFNDDVYLNSEGDSVRVNGAWRPLNVKIYDEDGIFWSLYTIQEGMVRFQQQVLKTQGSIKVDLPDEEYVGRQLDYVEQKFLKFYPDSILRKYMPLKIVLGSNLIRARIRGGNPYITTPNYTLLFNSYIFSHGDNTVDRLANMDICEINRDFIQRNFDERVNLETFYSYSDYTIEFDYGELLANGLLDNNSIYANISVNQTQDKRNFFNMITEYSYEYLTTVPDDLTDLSDPWDLRGVLDPSRDVNGLIRRKYDAMISAYGAMGIDLQAIGNANDN